MKRIGRTKAEREYLDNPNRAINFIAKPAYEPGDKPVFDRARFEKGAVFDPTKPPSASGAVLFATWQGGNKSTVSARVTRSAKSYEELSSAARPVDENGNPVPDWDAKYDYNPKDGSEQTARKYSFRVDPGRRSYGDLRWNGKARCHTDNSYGQAAQRSLETFLHKAIDHASAERRRQIKRQRITRLWQHDRCSKQPGRLLGFLKQPRTWLEGRILLCAVGWFLIQRETRGPACDLSTDKSINCVSNVARLRSRETDNRPPQHRRHVFPTHDEEIELISRAKDGDAIARERILSVHWPLVQSIAQKHVTPGHSAEDLIQEGFIGLIQSLDKFDPDLGNRLSTFAMRPIEWAILNYKRREQKKDVAGLDSAMIEIEERGALVNTDVFAGAPERSSRTSRLIRETAERMTVHISRYQGGLAPETRDFITELNAEAANDNSGVTYTGLANRIEVAGDIKKAATLPNMGGWFLRRARARGYTEGEAEFLRKGNSQRRKYLRKAAKRKSADTF